MNRFTAEDTYALLSPQMKSGQKLIEVRRFDAISGDVAFEQRRLEFDLVIWVSRGRGTQRINHTEYEMLPGRLFFIQAGQLHQICEYAEDGWMIFLTEEVRSNLHSFLLDNFYQQPYLDLKELSCETFMGLFSLLQVQLRQSEFNVMMIGNLLNGMLLCAEKKSFFLSNISAEDNRFALVRRLKALIEEGYKAHREPEHYYEILGLPGRRVNNTLKQLIGKTVCDLLQERLLLEAKYLLGHTQHSVKEISVELGFNSSGYFCRFFKKLTGITPLEYRESFYL